MNDRLILLHSSFVIRHSSFDRCWLNSVAVFMQRLPKNFRERHIMKDIHVRVVLPHVIVLPRFVPPAKTDDGRPAPREKILQRVLRPRARVDSSMMKRAPKLGDYDRLS